MRKRWFLLLSMLLFVWSVMANQSLGEWYARKLYPYISKLLYSISSLVPFSVGDSFIYCSIAVLLGYIIHAALLRRELRKSVSHIVEYLAWVYVWFYIAWGLNYFREELLARIDKPRVEFSAERFNSFLKAYTDSLNASWSDMESLDISTVRREVTDGFRRLSPGFHLVIPNEELHSKGMLIPSLMSGVGVMGYMGPFFSEFHINQRLLPVQLPSTYAHEMSHLLGVSSEAEANLCSFLVCTSSSVKEIRFSGYFSLLPYVISNAYVALDRDSFEIWRESLTPEVRELYNKKVEYWSPMYNPLIGDAQELLYNLFLKSNRISSGTANYSEVISLLIALDWR